MLHNHYKLKINHFQLPTPTGLNETIIRGELFSTPSYKMGKRGA
jgi:hypothetical protein